jgi:hypothetical protein
MARFKSGIFSLVGIGEAVEEMKYHPYIGETPKFGCMMICLYFIENEEALGKNQLRIGVKQF